MQRKYELSKRKSIRQIRSQTKYLRIINFSHKYFATVFGLFILKMFKDNLDASKSHHSYQWIVGVKAASYALFFIAFQSCTLSFFLNLYEIVLGSKFLTNRLEDLSDRIFELFEDEELTQNQRYMNKMLLQLSSDYNTVLRFQKGMNRHFGRVLKFVFALGCFTVIYPALVLFEKDKKNWLVYFYCCNYISIVLLLGLICLYNNLFLFAVRPYEVLLSRLIIRSPKILTKILTNLFINFFN